jgi:MoxR-like ATPase
MIDRAGQTVLLDAASTLRKALNAASRGLVEREALTEMVGLAAVAREHVLVIGPPGTAKSQAVRRVAQTLGGEYFEYLLGRFTEPSEIFGPIDLRRLKEGIVETETTGMLPQAEIAFLDEVFAGSTAILNTLLGLLNERVFRRGRTPMASPLRVCVGASNALPQDESLRAFADRFLIRVFVDPIEDPRLEELLAEGWSLRGDSLAAIASVAHIDALAKAAQEAEVGTLRSHIAHAVRLLRASGISLTDRRIVKLQRLASAAAVIAGRAAPTDADLWPIVYAIPTIEGQALARDVLRELLAPSQNAALPAAALEASLGPIARAQRILEAGREILSTRPNEDGAALEEWSLKLEGVAREIDAGFSKENLPQDLAALRERIVQAIAPARPSS